MKVFQKVLKIMKGAKVNGHALRNLRNRISVAKANKEIKEMLKGKE